MTSMNLGPWDATDLKCDLIPKATPRQSLPFRRVVVGAALFVGVGLISTSFVLSTSSFDTLATRLKRSPPPPISSVSDSVLHYSEVDYLTAFRKFMTDNDKHYDETERPIRFQNFKRNLAAIQLHDRPDAPYRLGINQFADLSYEEYRTQKLTYRPSKTTSRRPMNWLLGEASVGELPQSVDWRRSGCVTEVKNQAKCGSCWAFAATGAMEGNICVQTGELYDLSEQELVDCAKPEGNHGCHGGEADWAFQYVMDRGGLCSEAEYPYTGKDGECRASACESVVEIGGFVDIPPHNSAALMSGLLSYGPVAVAIEADQVAFQFYKSGVLNATCGEKLDHAVLLVGYGYDEVTDMDYWVVKNSWGGGWGENGFIRMVRDPLLSGNGECGILMEPSYVEVNSMFDDL